MTHDLPLPALLDRFRSKRILVIGDLMLDEFIWGKVSRISPEAPVPVVDVDAQSYFPGGAANVARNLREFTDHVTVMGLLGNDLHAEILKGLLSAREICLDGIQQSDDYQTIVKTRIIARQQHIVRVDRERRFAPEGSCYPQAVAQFEQAEVFLDQQRRMRRAIRWRSRSSKRCCPTSMRSSLRITRRGFSRRISSINSARSPGARAKSSRSIRIHGMTCVGRG